MDQTIATGMPRRFQPMKWILVLAILIVLNLLFAYSIQVFYPEPNYQDYCPVAQVTIQPKTQEECIAKGGGWTDFQNAPTKPIPARLDEYGNPILTGSCDINFTCNKKLEADRDIYQRNVFVARVILGMLALIVGFAVAQYEAVSLGLSLGGVLSLFIATVAYWSKLGQYFQVIVLAIALAALIWLGVKKMK